MVVPMLLGTQSDRANYGRLKSVAAEESTAGPDRERELPRVDHRPLPVPETDRLPPRRLTGYRPRRASWSARRRDSWVRCHQPTGAAFARTPPPLAMTMQAKPVPRTALVR